MILLSINPFIGIAENIVHKDKCLNIIATAAPLLSRAMVCGVNGDRVDNCRTSSNAWIDIQMPEIYHAVGLSKEYAEKMQVCKYGPGQYYEPHIDGFDDGFERYMNSGGQRTMTALVYLNNSDADTVFPDLGIYIKPKQGNMLVFHNTLLGSVKVDKRTRHGGAAGTTEKWVANIWFREKPYRVN